MDKVLLIYPPNQINPIEIPRADGSLGLLYLASALENAGIEVDVVDASIGTIEDSLNDTFYNRVRQENGLLKIGMSNDRIKELVSKYGIVGIHSNFTPQTRMVLETARLVKEVNPEILVITGGVNARNIPQKILESGIDVVCLTEGEKIIVNLVKQWFGKRNYQGIAGTAFMKDGRMVTLDSPIEWNLDNLPIPSWHKLSLVRYMEIGSVRGDILVKGLTCAPMMTSRGCPFRCIYCHISTEKDSIGRLRIKSIDRISKEFEILKSLGVQRVYFEDDGLLVNKKRVKEIFGHLVGCGLQMANDNGVNVAHLFKRDSQHHVVDIELLELLFNAGLNHFKIAVESGSQRILDKYASGKFNLSKMNVVELVKATSRIGIETPIGIMIGFPDETEEEIFQSIELGKRLVDAGAKYCSFYNVAPFPGSELYQIAIRGGYLDEDFDLDWFNWYQPVMKNTTVPPERLIELRQWAWETINPKDYVEKRIRANIS